MSDGFDDMDPEFKKQLKDDIIFSSDTGANKVVLKDYVQKMHPDLDKRAIYRTIKEMIRDGDLFYDDCRLLKSKQFYPNTAATKSRKNKRNN